MAARSRRWDCRRLSRMRAPFSPVPPAVGCSGRLTRARTGSQSTVAFPTSTSRRSPCHRPFRPTARCLRGSGPVSCLSPSTRIAWYTRGRPVGCSARPTEGIPGRRSTLGLHPNSTVLALAVSPTFSAEGLIFAGTEAGGVFRRADAIAPTSRVTFERTRWGVAALAALAIAAVSWRLFMCRRRSSQA